MMKKTILLLTELIVLFLLCEAGARLYEKFQYQSLPPYPGSEERFGTYENFIHWEETFAPYLAYASGKGLIYTPYIGTMNEPGYQASLKNYQTKINSLGFRSSEIKIPKPPGVFRVFILGGSTVINGFNDHAILSYFLQEELRKSIPGAEVVNAGMVGYSSVNEMILLETKILALQPDLVVVIDGRNDLFYSVMPDTSIEASEQRALDQLLNSPTMLSLTIYDIRLILKKSHFLSRLMHAFHKNKSESVYPAIGHISGNAIHSYLQNLKIMQAVLEANRIKGILIFQPTLGYGKEILSPYEKSTLAWMHNHDRTNWDSEVSRVWPKIGEKVASIPSSPHVRTYDFSKVFDQEKETTYSDSCHYTRIGLEVIAKKMAQVITKELR